MASTERRRRIRRLVGGIRMRVVVGYVILVTAVLAITVMVTRQVLLTRLDREIDRALVQEVEELRLLAGGTDPATGEPFGDDARAIFDTFLRRTVPDNDEAFYTFVDGVPFLSSFDAPSELLADTALVDTWATVQSPQRFVNETELGEVRSLAVPVRSETGIAGVFVASYFPEAPRNEALQAVRVITIAGVVVLLISAAVAWSLAGRVLRPIRQLTRTAQGITDADLSGRIPVAGHDELADLGHTFNDMVERLEAGFRSQRRFLDDVAHELRTPITIARGHLDLLSHDPDDLAETVWVVDDELERMSRYVDDLLVLAKAEQPDFLRLDVVDIGELADTLFQRASGLGRRTWVVDAAPPPGHIATIADERRLEQAVLNLAGNAVQHTTDGDEIGLGVALVDQQIHLWVRDTGPGISADVADTLFQRSTRGASSRGTRPDGSGIGLSIVDAIARAHGGMVSVTSTPGSGATFTVSIPFDTGPPTTEIPAAGTSMLQPRTSPAPTSPPTPTSDDSAAQRGASTQ